MEARSVDPRNASEEINSPAYRVDFWGQTGATNGDEGATISDEYLLTGAADVREVLSWADSLAQGRDVVVYAVYPGFEPGHTLIRLTGNPRA